MTTRLRVNDVAKAVGCSPNTLRRYEREGIVPRAARDRVGWRTYSFADVELIERVIAGSDHKDRNHENSPK